MLLDNFSRQSLVIWQNVKTEEQIDLGLMIFISLDHLFNETKPLIVIGIIVRSVLVQLNVLFWMKLK